MINNLFSMFDPSSYYLNTGWVMILFPLLIFMGTYWANINNNIIIINISANKINNEIIVLNGNEENKLTSGTLINLFTFVIIVNVVAILPINFTPTAHISISLYLSLTIWIATIVNGVVNSTNNMVTHLTPIGTPTPLINFIVLIELISNLIRPITLAVRLTANIVAGHLLISLLSNFSITSVSCIVISSAPIITLVLLESAVAIIQAYVITILVCLYYKETF